ncbi:MAG: type III-B CRISPR module-associated protein Cmr3 [Chloroflexi bacterium]|nr:type III-B CRISPR module-associated protein Cmr3 [Chloroflexota bacterium]
MSLWIIEPRDPLIFRDGKPFSAVPGAMAKSLPFPFPSTIAGGVRTHAGPDADGRFSEKRIDELLSLSIRGPLLVEVGWDRKVTEWFVPAPADALVFRGDNDEEGRRRRLKPARVPDGARTNLVDRLVPVALGRTMEKSKPHPKAPRFWKWRAFEEWLVAPTDDLAAGPMDAWGQEGPVRERRIHVAMEAVTQTAKEGALFQTSGLEFVSGGRKDLSRVREMALAVETDAEMKEGLGFLGGERRAVSWRRTDMTLPPQPAGLADIVVGQKRCRLILLTPGLFERGHLPTWMVEECCPDVEVRIVAAAVPRYQAVSGWDYEKRKPKPTRRLAPAGSVYFLELNGDDDAIRRFVDAVWMQNVSDGEQDRRDGFGLAVVGVWDGVLVEMEGGR